MAQIVRTTARQISRDSMVREELLRAGFANRRAVSLPHLPAIEYMPTLLSLASHGQLFAEVASAANPLLARRGRRGVLVARPGLLSGI